MVQPDDYTKYAIIKCRSRGILYHKEANKWGRIHWWIGVVNSLVSSIISLFAFIAQRNDWSSTEVAMVGGLALSISNSVLTSLNAGKTQKENEEAGDAYRNLESKILSQLNNLQDEEQAVDLREVFRDKLEKLSNKYTEPNPQKCIALEKTIGENMFKNGVVNEVILGN